MNRASKRASMGGDPRGAGKRAFPKTSDGRRNPTLVDRQKEEWYDEHRRQRKQHGTPLAHPVRRTGRASQPDRQVGGSEREPGARSSVQLVLVPGVRRNDAQLRADRRRRAEGKRRNDRHSGRGHERPGVAGGNG